MSDQVNVVVSLAQLEEAIKQIGIDGNAPGAAIPQDIFDALIADTKKLKGHPGDGPIKAGHSFGHLRFPPALDTVHLDATLAAVVPGIHLVRCEDAFVEVHHDSKHLAIVPALPDAPPKDSNFYSNIATRPRLQLKAHFFLLMYLNSPNIPTDAAEVKSILPISELQVHTGLPWEYIHGAVKVLRATAKRRKDVTKFTLKQCLKLEDAPLKAHLSPRTAVGCVVVFSKVDRAVWKVEKAGGPGSTWVFISTNGGVETRIRLKHNQTRAHHDPEFVATAAGGALPIKEEDQDETFVVYDFDITATRRRKAKPENKEETTAAISLLQRLSRGPEQHPEERPNENAAGEEDGETTDGGISTGEEDGESTGRGISKSTTSTNAQSQRHADAAFSSPRGLSDLLGSSVGTPAAKKAAQAAQAKEAAKEAAKAAADTKKRKPAAATKAAKATAATKRKAATPESQKKKKQTKITDSNQPGIGAAARRLLALPGSSEANRIRGLLCPGDNKTRPTVRIQYRGFQGGPHMATVLRYPSKDNRGGKIKGEPAFKWDNKDPVLGFLSASMATTDDLNFKIEGSEHEFTLIPHSEE